MNFAVRHILISTAFVLLGVYSYFTLSGPQGISSLLAKQQEIRRLEEENANLVRENDLKRDRIRKLRESATQQDLVIHDKLKMLHPDETEFILSDGDKNDATKPEPETSTKP